MVVTLANALKLLTSRSGLGMVFIGLQALLMFMFQFSDQFSSKKDNVYNILWVLVFGFATLNILGLVARRLEPRRQARRSSVLKRGLPVATSAAP